jgi:cyanophycinase
MTGKIMLIGGGEFQKGVEGADKEAFEFVGGTLAPAIILAVASGARKTSDLINEGLAWFNKIGAYNLKGLAINNREEADNAEHTETIVNNKLIYLVGGDPSFIPETLLNTALYEALKTAVYKRNAVLVGSGAGAMALAQHFYNTDNHKIEKGLNFVPDTVVIPYFSTNGRKWYKIIQPQMSNTYIIGLDEKTGMFGFGNDWQVCGRSWITVYKNDKPRKFVKGQPFKLVP